MVVLNDNDGSIDPTIGALHESNRYSSYIQSLGWEYTYLAEGNDVLALLESLKSVIDRGGKQVLHIRTTKPHLSRVNPTNQNNLPVVGGGANAFDINVKRQAAGILSGDVCK